MRKFALPAICAAAILMPQVASAHLVVSGMGPIYDGITHFGLSPEDFLPVIALGLLAGLRGSRHARVALAALPLAWIAGGIAAMLGLGLPPILLSVATAALFLMAGGLLAANLPLTPAACAGAAAILGSLRGPADLAGVQASLAHFLTLLGMSASVFVVFALAASLTLPLRHFGLIVAARVGGSWLAALGLLLAGWIARYGPVIH